MFSAENAEKVGVNNVLAQFIKMYYSKYHTNFVTMTTRNSYLGQFLMKSCIAKTRQIGKAVDFS